MEYGVIIPQGSSYVRTAISITLEDATNTLTSLFLTLFYELYEVLLHLNERIVELEQKLQAISLQREDVRRLLTISEIGLLTATSVVAAINGIAEFKNRREPAACLGLVLRQHCTGGKKYCWVLANVGTFISYERY